MEGPVLALLKSGTLFVAAAIEGMAAVLITLAAIEAAAASLALFLREHAPSAAREMIRLRLGRWLGLGLEFELAAGILRAAVEPTWNRIGALAAIFVLRTGLNYILEREIEKASTLPGSPGGPY
jgi:uncharacterized membrane protein